MIKNFFQIRISQLIMLLSSCSFCNKLIICAIEFDNFILGKRQIPKMQKDPIWDELRHKLPFGTSQADTQRRLQIWKSFDVNSNGYLSLAQVDKGCIDVLNLPRLFNLKPVIMRAYQTAKNKLKAKNKYGDDYVSRAQFRYFLQYLRQYYEYWVAFTRIDTNFDQRVSKAEFAKAVPLMEKWGIKITDPAKTFRQIDTDNGGMILFDQFCRWAIKKNLDIDDDDDLL